MLFCGAGGGGVLITVTVANDIVQRDGGGACVSAGTGPLGFHGGFGMRGSRRGTDVSKNYGGELDLEVRI